MNIGNSAHELADRRAAEERASGIARASVAVRQAGSGTCVDCGRAISPARRKAAPFARRCVGCQEDRERGL